MASRYMQVTNQAAIHAFPGTAILITLNSAESISKLPLLANDMKCTLGSSSNFGYIVSVDSKGHTFKILPTQRDKTLDGVGVNNVPVGEIIQIQLS